VTVIDFGLATKYFDFEKDMHVSKKLMDVFRGNVEFASLNQMKFHTTSRRDDLISLFYIMIYMLKGGCMPGYRVSKGEHQLYDSF